MPVSSGLPTIFHFNFHQSQLKFRCSQQVADLPKPETPERCFQAVLNKNRSCHSVSIFRYWKPLGFWQWYKTFSNTMLHLFLLCIFLSFWDNMQKNVWRSYYDKICICKILVKVNLALILNLQCFMLTFEWCFGMNICKTPWIKEKGKYQSGGVPS